LNSDSFYNVGKSNSITLDMQRITIQRITNNYP